MNDQAHITENIALLVMLDEADPERRSALEHVGACAACAASWREADAALGLLGSGALPPPSEATLRAIEAGVLSALPVPRAAAFGAPTVVVAVFGLLVLTAKYRVVDPLAWVMAAVCLLVALFGAARAGNAGRWPLAGVLLASVGLVALTLRAPSDALAPLLGIKCVIIELIAAALPFAATAYAARRWNIALPSLTGATVATAGALAGQAALHITCRAHGAWPHEVVFHLGTVVASTVLGAMGAGPVNAWAARGVRLAVARGSARVSARQG